MNTVSPCMLAAPHFVHQVYTIRLDTQENLSIVPCGLCHIMAIYGDPILLNGKQVSGVVLLHHQSTTLEMSSSGKSVIIFARCIALAQYYINNDTHDRDALIGETTINQINHNLNLQYKQIDKERHFNRYLRLITIPKQPPLLDSVLRYIYQLQGCVSTRDIITRYATNARELQSQFQKFIEDAPTAYGQKVCFYACVSELCTTGGKNPRGVIHKYYAGMESYNRMVLKFNQGRDPLATFSKLTIQFLKLDYRLTTSCPMPFN
ncbi:MAG: hypothetical protein WBA16_09145 [Nonlabens sp.]